MINSSQFSRMLWLTLLAPEIGKAILKKRQSEGLMPSALALLKGLPVGWGAQLSQIPDYRSNHAANALPGQSA